MTARIFGIAGPVPVRRWATFFEILWPGAGAAGGDPAAVPGGRAGERALPRQLQPHQPLRRQCLYRRGRHRHVAGDHLGPYRRLRGLADRRAGDHLRDSRGPWLSHHHRLAGAADPRHGDQRLRRGADRLSAHSLHRDDAGHALDPEGRADQRHRRGLDHQSAARLSHRPVPPLRDPSPVYFMVVLTILARSGRGIRASGAISMPSAAIPRRHGSAASTSNPPS